MHYIPIYQTLWIPDSEQAEPQLGQQKLASVKTFALRQ